MTSQVVINDIIPRTQAIATSSQTVFDTDWTANAASDVRVYSRTASQEPDDQTQLVSPNDYNVTFIGTYEMVRVTFLVGRGTGDIVTISRETPADRLNLYTNTNFTTSMLNEDMGILTLVDQQAQLFDQILAPHYNVSESFTAPPDYDIDLVLPLLEANQFWVKNAANTRIIPATLPGGGGGLPNAGPFVTYTADAELTNAQDLGLLTNGLLKQTVSAAVSTIEIVDEEQNAVVICDETGNFETLQTLTNSVLIGNDSGELEWLASSPGKLLGTNAITGDIEWTEVADITQAPTVQKFLSGSGTYTTPVNPSPLWIQVEIVGGGGGGGGSGSSTGTAATAGGTSSFGTSLITCAGGTQGGHQAAGGLAGAATINSPAVGLAVSGSSGGQSSEILFGVGAGDSVLPGGYGAPSALGGGAGQSYVAAAYNAAANTGGGGGGAGTAVTTTTRMFSGSGGGSGAYFKGIIPNPDASYAYAVGAGGNGGGAGAGGFAGGNGGSGQIVITEFYQ